MNGVRTLLTNGAGGSLFAVLSNIESGTVPDYCRLAKQDSYWLGNGIRVWAGTAEAPFFIDVGAASTPSLPCRGRRS